MKSLPVKIIFLVLTILILIYNPITIRIMSYSIASRYHLDKVMFYRLIKTESTFRGLAISRQHAIGPAQIQESTAQYLDPDYQRGYLFFPLYNLKISALYIQYLLKKYDNNWSLAIAAYNWGETNVTRKVAGLKIEPEVNYRYLFENVRETNNMLRKILEQ